MSAFEYSHYISKIGEGKSHCLVTNELRKENGHKNRFTPRLRKLRQLSESPKRHWIFVPWSFSFAILDPKTKTNFEGETLYRALISVTPSDSRIRKISDSRIFLWVSSEHTKWPSSDFSLTWAECDSSRDLCQTTPVCELFKPAEFGSRFSSEARTQSSSEWRKKLNIPFLDGCWLSASTEFVGCWLSKWFATIKLSSDFDHSDRTAFLE